MEKSDFQSCHIILFKLSNSQQKIMSHEKKNRKLWPTEGGKQSRETVSEETQMLDVSDKNFKSSITNTFKELMKTTPKKTKEIYKNEISSSRKHQ